MRILVDAFGGDNAPLEILKASIKAEKELGVDIVLVGDTAKMYEVAHENSLDIDNMMTVHTDDIFDIHAQASSILKEGKNSSLAIGLQELKENTGDAFVSAGSSGGLVAGTLFIIGRIPGIKRIAMSPTLPTIKNRCLLADAGANIECKPEYIYQFGLMGSAYMQAVKGLDKPRIGLLNIGVEETKGRDLEKEAYKLLSNSSLNFIGNIEARDIPFGVVDAVICDGYSGNIALKMLEGMGSVFIGEMKKWFKDSSSIDKEILSQVMGFKEQFDYKEEGGAILLGANKPVIKAHGNSDERSFFNAIKQAKLCVEKDMINNIKNIKLN